jgi:hypothetical protein
MNCLKCGIYCKVYWKKEGDGGLCKTCSKQPPKSLAKRSKKKIKEDSEYTILRREYVDKHSICQVKLPGCSIHATEIHHRYSGTNKQKHYLDTTTWKAACRFCHTFIHDKLSSDDARELNLKI